MFEQLKSLTLQLERVSREAKEAESRHEQTTQETVAGVMTTLREREDQLALLTKALISKMIPGHELELVDSETRLETLLTELATQDAPPQYAGADTKTERVLSVAVPLDLGLEGEGAAESGTPEKAVAKLSSLLRLARQKIEQLSQSLQTQEAVLEGLRVNCRTAEVRVWDTRM